LAHGRQHHLERQELRDVPLQSQTYQTHSCQYDAIDLPLVHLPQAGIDIAADVLHV
jgi:hypothetical protein